NMGHIAGGQGRFLTGLPRTPAEGARFPGYLQEHAAARGAVRREPNPPPPDGAGAAYHGGESPQRSAGCSRALWRPSSQKRNDDCTQRQARMQRARVWLEGLQAPSRRPFRTYGKAHRAGMEVLQREGAERWLRIRVETDVEETFRQVGPGWP